MPYAGGKLDKAREVFAARDQASTADPADHSAAEPRFRAVAGRTLTLGGRDLPTRSLIEESTLGNSTHVTIPSIARGDPCATLDLTRAPTSPPSALVGTQGRLCSPEAQGGLFHGSVPLIPS